MVAFHEWEEGPSGRTRVRWALLGAGVAALVIAGTVLGLVLLGAFLRHGGVLRPFFGFVGGFFLLFLLFLIALVAVRLAFWGGRLGYYGHRFGRGPGYYGDPAVRVVRERYARGEITREQFDQIMTDLERRGRGPGGPLSGASPPPA